MTDDQTTADILFDQVIDLRDAIQAFEQAHVEPQTEAEDTFSAATQALRDLAFVLVRWDQEDS